MLTWLSELTAFLIPEPAWGGNDEPDLFSHGWQYQHPAWWESQPQDSVLPAPDESDGLDQLRDRLRH
ncbi:hypothetical protein [Chitinilyticum aquatile]|uniref:hypothetical protein n=1 Tax=Chitinilyticum aquatile TaxID=362520 RepID=UPI0003F7283C|nr:hypothetical protein [Chitinilyticum aquatile]